MVPERCVGGIELAVLYEEVHVLVVEIVLVGRAVEGKCEAEVPEQTLEDFAVDCVVVSFLLEMGVKALSFV